MSARSVAMGVVLDVHEDDVFANLALPSRLQAARLSQADAAFATELTYGTLRWQGQYDEVIESLARRSVHDIDPEPLAALRIGLHQIARMRVADHAAVHESVGLLRGSAGQRGFVNAILRKTVSVGYQHLLHGLLADRRGDERLALLHAHPLWIVRALRDSLAHEGAEGELDALLESDNVPPAVHLVALPGLSARRDLGGSHTVSPVGATLAGGDPAAHELVREGTARVQDSGSQLAALALVRAQPVASGERWLDMCAGPGGKAALLAATAAQAGATLTANESQPHRSTLVERALERFTASVTVRDGRTFKHEPAAFDRILVDAPCTGIGALRRRPESRWRKHPDDVAQLASLQTQLLEAALTAVKPGGIVAYVTCSPHLAETSEVVDAVLERHSAERLDTSSVMQQLSPGLTLADRDGAVQLWPHRHETDAMFVQLLRRV